MTSDVDWEVSSESDEDTLDHDTNVMLFFC